MESNILNSLGIDPGIIVIAMMGIMIFVLLYMVRVSMKMTSFMKRYRIFMRGNAVWCEYIGAYRGLLEQKLLPSLTPKMNILDSEVVESSLTGNKRQTLRTYSSENLKLKNFRRDNFKEEYNVTSPQDHPTVVYDEYIKEGMPMPSPYGDSQQSK